MSTESKLRSFVPPVQAVPSDHRQHPTEVLPLSSPWHVGIDSTAGLAAGFAFS